MRRDSFERFYCEKVALEGCGCAEYVITRLRDLDGLAVKAECEWHRLVGTGASACLAPAGGQDKEGRREGKLALGEVAAAARSVLYCMAHIASFRFGRKWCTIKCRDFSIRRVEVNRFQASSPMGI